MVGWFGAWRGKADHFATFQNGVKRACLQGISSPFCCADSAHCGPLSFLGRADVCKATKATNNNKIKHLLSSFTSFAFVCCLITPTQTTQHTHSLTHAHGLTHAHTRTHIMSQNAAHGMATAEVAHNTASDGKPVKKKQPKHKASPPNADQLKQQQHPNDAAAKKTKKNKKKSSTGTATPGTNEGAAVASKAPQQGSPSPLKNKKKTPRKPSQPQQQESAVSQVPHTTHVVTRVTFFL